jgi:hypothetical protein
MSKRTYLILRFLQSLLFPMVIVAIGVYVFVASFSYQFETKAFASATGGILIILSVAVLVRDIVRGVADLGSKLESVPTQTDHRIPPLMIALAWCVGFFVVALLIGFLLAIPVWMFAVLLRNRASRALTFIMPVVLWAIMKFGVEYGLGFLFFEGILFGDKPSAFW